MRVALSGEEQLASVCQFDILTEDSRIYSEILARRAHLPVRGIAIVKEMCVRSTRRGRQLRPPDRSRTLLGLRGNPDEEPD
jgi:hypothetical protein